MKKKSSESPDPSKKQRSEPEIQKQANSGSNQPIAIVGMACRFPGAPNISAFWRLLEAGENAVTRGSPGESNGRVGQMFPNDVPVHDASRFGAFLSGIDQFDAEFFRISPLEAASLDPQQRLLLELSWEALEDAGIAPERLVGSRTGVYAGIGSYEYQELACAGSESIGPDATLYMVTGNRFSTASGRVSFFLGLQGPSVAIDTACSSSLVAMHQAITGLERGETDLAIAGGVCVILSPLTTEVMANAGMLSPTGQCWTFDERADGFVRSEGCGMLVLKRLDEAEAAGDRIWGVIRGSAINQDGVRPGLSVPIRLTQEQVIEDALARASVAPSQVDYLEAHGTGTKLGDPVEIAAAASVYGRGRNDERPLLVGSVKTNIGHLAAAAGTAGLIKVLLAMRQGVIPKHLNFRNPNPQIPWNPRVVQVTSEMMDWPGTPDRPPRAAVNSFGFSGTNAHVVVEGYPAPDTTGADEKQWPTGAAQPVAVALPEFAADLPVKTGELTARATRFLPLSGKSDDALRDLAKRYLSWLDERGLSSGDAVEPLLADMAWTAGTGRSHFDHRAGAVFHDVASLRDRLKALAEAGQDAEPRMATTVAFAYTGQASQWVGMGEALYASEPMVRAVLDRCDAVLRETRGASLLDVMFGRAATQGDLYDVAWTQPAIYALECALTALWASAGIRPDVVVGHSLGELAAAQAAGVFGLEDGLRFAATRGALMAALPEAGAMAAVFAPAPQVAEAVREQNAATGYAGVSVAADNGSHQVVSGTIEAVEAISERFLSENLLVNRLNTTLGAHSALVEPALDDLEAALANTAIAPPSLALVSNVTGRVMGPGETLDAAYWRRQAREPVAFASGVRTLADRGVDLVLEIGPHAVLGPMVSLAWPKSDRTPAPAVLWSLRQPSDNAPAGNSTFVKAVAGAYTAGLPIRFAGLFAGETRRRIALPAYPFQRRRHWVDAQKRRSSDAGHPLLGTRQDSAHGDTVFASEVRATDPEWLNDHRVFDQVVAPGALFGAMAAGALWSEGVRSVTLEECQLHSPMILRDEKAEGNGKSREASRKLQLLCEGPKTQSSRRFEVFSKGSEDDWILHMNGRMLPDVSPDAVPARMDLDAVRAGLTRGDVATLYRNKASTKVVLGPAFRLLQTICFGPGEAIGDIVLPQGLEQSGMDMHPILLDGCFQVLMAARDQARRAGQSTYMPFGWERLWLLGPPPQHVVCHVRMRGSGAGAEAIRDDSAEVLKADLWIYAPDGEPIGGVEGFTMKRATRAAMLATMTEVHDLLYEVAWRERAPAKGPGSTRLPAGAATGAARCASFSDYLHMEGVSPAQLVELLTDLDCLSRSYAVAAFQRLDCRRHAGAAVEPQALADVLGVGAEHRKLFTRLILMLNEAGVLTPGADGKLAVAVGRGEPLPDGGLGDPQRLAADLEAKHPYGRNEIGLLRRCGEALADVLLGRTEPLTLLFGSGEPSAADVYRHSVAAHASHRLLADALLPLCKALPEGRTLRVLEVGAGTGSATEAVRSVLPDGRFDYVFTDVSAGFFAAAEERFGGAEASFDYRVLNIEVDPSTQGFDRQGYDLVIASNVLHATRHLGETLTHCGSLLAPGGRLVVLEIMRARHWQDLTFGLLEGWWRFADPYRPASAIAGPAVWRQALGDAGFSDVTILGGGDDSAGTQVERALILARAPTETQPPGVWVLVCDRSGVGDALTRELAVRNQTVVVACENDAVGPDLHEVVKTRVSLQRRESWKSLFDGLPPAPALQGIVHLASLDGHGRRATSGEIAQDVKHAQASALALAQGAMDAGVTLAKGLWLVTRGAQVLEREREGTPAGATLWGFGKVLACEVSHLMPRMIDLDPEVPVDCSVLADELLWPDGENHIAWRGGRRHAARLVRSGVARPRMSLPDERGWRLEPGAGRTLDSLHVATVPARPLQPGEVRVAIEAAGLNFRDVLRTLGMLESGELGCELCGRVVDVGAQVSHLSVGDRVVGMTFGTFATEVVTRAELLVLAPAGIPSAVLAGVSTAFVSADLSFELAGIKPGERVLIHAGAGGVGLAAIQLAQAAGARIFATASAPKQGFLRSLGVDAVYDSRTLAFGRAVLEDTGGDGVDIVLNSLTGRGFIETSLSCLARGGRFVELGVRDIWSAEDVAMARPDVGYSVFYLDNFKERDFVRAGRALASVMRRIEAGDLTPIPHLCWSMAETSSAMAFMRSSKHIGKIVLTQPPCAHGRVRGDATYLVTGGFGGIGCALAGWLADHGAGTIVLNGRRPPDAAARETIRALESRGVTVRSEIADVTVAAEVAAMLGRIDAELPPLAGIVHSVGVLADASLVNQSWESFETVVWPKVLGAWNLHRATEHRDLDLFVLFSSAAGVMGTPGQANHAAANAFLDQLAAHRRALGLPGQTIAWGAWSELGEAEEHRERIAGHLSARGVRWMTPRQGLQVFERLLREDAGNAVVMAADWPVYGAAPTAPLPLIEELLSLGSRETAPVPEMPKRQDDLLTRLRSAALSEREGLLCTFVLDELQSIMRLPARPAPRARFFDLGMDSLMAVELRNRLNRAFAGAYVASNTLVFDYPDAHTLTRFLVDELAEALGGESESKPVSAPAEQIVRERPHHGPGSDESIAIVGMACRYPGAPDLTAYWNRLASGVDLISDGRPDFESWSHGVGDPGAVHASLRRGGFVSGIDCFDAGFFGIRPIEAKAMDPQHRMLLETSWHALEDAAIDPSRLQGARAGVYVGLGPGEYRDLINAGGEHGGYFGTMGSIAVSRIAFALGLVGPAIPLDLNCASSLVAVHEAAMALQRGEIELALAGGVNAILSSGVMGFLIEHGLLSPTGHCASFDASADGYVRGEGCGVIVLKRYRDAQSDGDRIWGVIRGSAVNHSGTGAGLTMPNGPAQQQVMQDALARAGVAPSDVDYVEANAVGSALGDPIEVQATAMVYGNGREQERPLLVGSVKSNMGHLEAAAGIAGLIKVVLSMRYGTIPKQLHFETPSPHVDWNLLPVRIASQSIDWPRKQDRTAHAGVSAFGLSGTNAHVVVEGYGDPDAAGFDGGHWPAGAAQPVAVTLPESVATLSLAEEEFASRKTRVLPLSGKSGVALREMAKQYLAWLDGLALSSGDATDHLLADVAWTAGIGRSHFEHRAGVVFRDAASLREGLEKLVEGGGQVPRPTTKTAFTYTGQAGRWIRMGEALYASEPVVRAVLDRCDEVLREARGASLLDAMFGQAATKGDLHDVAWTQPAVYALECALTALWVSVGIRPNVVLGRGLGELAAAQAAGVFGLEDGLRFAAARGALTGGLPERGAQAAGLDDLETALKDVAFATPSRTLVSSMTGRVVETGETLDATYWRSQANEPETFDRCAEALADLGVETVVEIGPCAIQDSATDVDETPVVLSSLREPGAFAEAVAEAYSAGLPVSFAGLFAGETRRRISLPGYPFQRRRHWVRMPKR